jgi:uroporphyrinogen decarboxylase
MGLFLNRPSSNGKNGVPVWFMRQAGRYHSHYQNLKLKHTFLQLCKQPELACEVTLGPIEDFKFDAAILFSDLLFPLEYMGFGLDYNPGPVLDRHLETDQSWNDLNKNAHTNAQEFYTFQKKACELLKVKLPPQVTLLGFVGAPLTLFSYAAEGGHDGNLISTKKGLYDGRFEKFFEKLYPHLLQEMILQSEGGAEAICLFDTSSGELCFDDYVRFVTPKIDFVISEFKKVCPQTKVVYYSKCTHIEYIQSLNLKNIDVIGVDGRMDLAKVFQTLPAHLYIQGNIDPSWLHLPWKDLENNLELLKTKMIKSNVDFSRWIFGLGHGVLQKTPESNVRQTVEWVHENLLY